MIKNIVFDVGDVLIRFRYRDHMRDLGFSAAIWFWRNSGV